MQSDNAMKIRIKIILWWTLASNLLTGCSTVQDNQLYQSWQERAYSAYGMPVPSGSSSPLMTAEIRSATSSAAPANEDVLYIAEHYALR